VREAANFFFLFGFKIKNNRVGFKFCDL